MAGVEEFWGFELVSRDEIVVILGYALTSGLLEEVAIGYGIAESD